jgi:hypothetical protein
VLEIFAGFQAFTWRTCPLPLGTVVGNSILNKDLRILIKDSPDRGEETKISPLNSLTKS